ncbi:MULTISPECIES: LPXTG cell wall anchor domain-containing protein [Amylolactobacillus]|nr:MULTISPECIES: LPXTG cell wall anchor domain-containing protein [Amylolactobacillus]
MTANTNSTNSGQPTTVSAIDQDKLPQTDEAKSNAGIFGMIMLALSGLVLGFGKRRKEEDK